MTPLQPAAIGLACLLLAGCNVTAAGSLADSQDSKVGKTFWINSYFSASAQWCESPAGVLGQGPCQIIPRGGSFTVVETANSGYPAFQRFYKVKLATGQEGYVRTGVVDAALDEAAHARQTEIDAEKQKKIKAEKAACDRKGSVRIGMTRAQVYASCFGKPERINTTASAHGTDEQFVYGNGTYIYLTNGIVRSWQQSTR